MALLSKVGSFAIPGDNDAKAVTGVGFQPKAILCWADRGTSDGSNASAHFSLGGATSATSRFFIGAGSNDAQAVGDCNSYQNNAQMIGAFTPGGSGAATDLIDLVSFDADGFTYISDSTPTSIGLIVNYLLLGGSSITNAAVLQFQCPATTGDEAYTGVGFQPDLIIIVTGPAGGAPPALSASGRISIGWGTSSSSQVAVQNQYFNGDDPHQCEHGQSTGDIILFRSTCIAQLLSLDADGFTLNFSTTVSGLYAWAICIKGGRYAIGEISQPSGTGTQSTNVGFRPSFLLMASVNDDTDADTETTGSARLSFGAATSPTERGCIWVGDSDNVGTTVSDSNLDRTVAIKMMTEGTPTENAKADLDSFTGNAFVLDWESADSTARKIVYLAGDSEQSAGGGGGQGGGGGRPGGGGPGGGGGGGGPGGGGGGGPGNKKDAIVASRRHKRLYAGVL